MSNAGRSAEEEGKALAEFKFHHDYLRQKAGFTRYPHNSVHSDARKLRGDTHLGRQEQQNADYARKTCLIAAKAAGNRPQEGEKI